MPSNQKLKKLLKNRALLLGALFLLVCLFGGGLLFYRYVLSGSGATGKAAQDLLHQAEAFSDSNNPAKQAESLSKINADRLGSAQKAEYYALQGQAFQNMHQLPQAIEAYKQSLRFDPTNQSIVLIVAQDADSMGDYKTAATYYQKALELLQTDLKNKPGTSAQGDLNYLNNQLTRVKQHE